MHAVLSAAHTLIAQAEPAPTTGGVVNELYVYGVILFLLAVVGSLAGVSIASKHKTGKISKAGEQAGIVILGATIVFMSIGGTLFLAAKMFGGHVFGQ